MENSEVQLQKLSQIQEMLSSMQNRYKNVQEQMKQIEQDMSMVQNHLALLLQEQVAKQQESYYSEFRETSESFHIEKKAPPVVQMELIQSEEISLPNLPGQFQSQGNEIHNKWVNEEGKKLTFVGFDKTNDFHMEKLLLLPFIQEIDLSSSRISNQGVQHFSQLTNLEKINLENSLITDTAMEHLLGLKNLLSLDLGNTKITNKSIRQLVYFPQLRELYLSYCQFITLENVTEISQLQKLEILNLQNTLVNDEGLILVSQLSSLGQLILHNCPEITDEGLECLQSLSSLKELHILECQKITVKGIEKLQTQLPQAEIYW